MRQTEDPANTDRPLADSGRLDDEELDAVTGGLLHPPEPSVDENRRIGGRIGTGNEETTDS